MTRKRRMFEIEVPVEDAVETVPAGKVQVDARRGPMATAIAETVESSRDRAEVEAIIRAENDALAQEHVRLKRAGLITDLIPLELIDARKLIRDRSSGPDSEIGELVKSIRELGLSNPIQIEPSEGGRYELIQGHRRLSAYQQLLAETGDVESWGRIPAGISARGDALDRLYRRMVDENMVRKDISFAEMAQLALRYAQDPCTDEKDPEKAVAVLFKSAGYQKRSYIRNFIPLMEQLGDVLRYPEAISRALGLALAQQIGEEPALVHKIASQLQSIDTSTPAGEIELLRRFAWPDEEVVTRPTRQVKDATLTIAKAKTTFQIPRRNGVSAKCVAANGRLEIRLPRDFTTIDRLRLEATVARLLDDLE